MISFSIVILVLKFIKYFEKHLSDSELVKCSLLAFFKYFQRPLSKWSNAEVHWTIIWNTHQHYTL